MKKSTFIKRFVALLLVVLMSIDAFAAVVGDNDGAAFITKAEFDSMKTEFQSQLDRYNSSIDNKIDGAIAAYLAGIGVAKEYRLSFVNGIRHFKGINDFQKINGRVDMWHAVCAIDMGNQDANWTMGFEGAAEITTPGTTGKGIEGIVVSDNGKDLIIGKYGEYIDKTTSTKVFSTTDRGPIPGVSGRVANWQLSWAIPGVARDADKSGEYDKFVKQENIGTNIYPVSYGIDSVNTQWASYVYAGTPNRFAHERTWTYDETQMGYLVNDETVNTIYDSINYNNIQIIQDNTYNSTINGWFKVVNNGFPSRTWTNNNNNPIWREWNSLGADSGWNLVGDGTSSWLGMKRTQTTWNSSQIGDNLFFNGKNKELYVAPVKNPNHIYTNIYTNDVWVDWAKKNVTTQKIVLLKDGTYLWDLRYGNLLVAEEVKDSAKYKLSVTNNGTSTCYIKFFTGIKSTDFDSVTGIHTNKSEISNKEAVKINAGASVKIEFEVKNSDPVFFKCSNGAEITFGDTLIKEDA